MQPVGTTWLREKFDIAPTNVSHESYIGGRRQRKETPSGQIEEIFSKNYWPGDTPLHHIEFSLKYDHLNLDLLDQVFRQLSAKEVDRYIAARPTSKYRRKIGLLYEFITPKSLSTKVSGNFLPLLDPKSYYTGKPIKNDRWRITDNLLGTSGFCPIIRKTDIIETQLEKDWPTRIRQIANEADPALLARAVNYLYLKETKASFEIEREEISGSRAERFVQVLARAGQDSMDNVLDEKRLTTLQNLIVDKRYANSGFRTNQNYVGETLPGFSEKVHYVCPPPQLVRTLMAGLRSFIKRSPELSAPLRAAVLSFGFVYAHPFEDGNGRLHRLLLHESLAFDGFVDRSIVLPFSAVMLRDQYAYDQALEAFSKTVLLRANYGLDRSGTLAITNPHEASGVWRYPDYTKQVEYVLKMIESTVTFDLPQELGVLRNLDNARRTIKEIVDLPNPKMNLLLNLLYQNRGILSSTKTKSHFSELTAKEIKAIEESFREAFGMVSE